MTCLDHKKCKCNCPNDCEHDFSRKIHELKNDKIISSY